MGEEIQYLHPFDGDKSISIAGKTGSITGGEL